MKAGEAWPEKVWRAARISLAAAIVVWLAGQVGVRAVLEQLGRVSGPLLSGSVALLTLDGVAKAWNWRQLLAAIVPDRPIPFSRVLAWHFAGGFLGAVVPSSVSTDAFRVLLGKNALPGHGIACAASVVTLNGLGWFAGCVCGVVGIVGLLPRPGPLPPSLEPVALLFVAVLISLPAGYALLAMRRGHLMRWLRPGRPRWERLKRGVRNFLDALLVLQRAHVGFLPYLSVALLAVLAQAGMYALTAAAVGIRLPFAVWLVVAPFTRLVALIPISIADFGLIQAAHVYLLARFGVPPWQSFTLSALFAIQGLLIHATLGSVAFIYGARRLRPEIPGRSRFTP